MNIKITKDGESQTIVSSLEVAQELFPASDGYTHEVVDDSMPARHQKAQKEIEGRAWRDNDLLRTDLFVLLPDHPDKDRFIEYRQKLRDWPSTSNFPDTVPKINPEAGN